MPEYEYANEMFDPDEETVDLPDDAEGITVSTFGDYAHVRYLKPVEGDEETNG